MLVLRPTDEIPVQIGEITLWVSPLTLQQKTHCVSKGTDDQHAMLFEALRYSVKSVEGLKDVTYPDGSPAQIEFEDGKLSEEGLEVLAQIVGLTPLSQLSTKVLTNLSDLEINGVKIDPTKIRNSKKK